MSVDPLAGHVTVFYAFDVAEAVDLTILAGLLGGATRPTPLAPRSAAPPHLQYQQPPLVLDGASVAIAAVDGFRARFKIFDYGVVSIALRRPLSDAWTNVVGMIVALMADETLAHKAEGACRQFVDPIGAALNRPHGRTLFEEYVVVTLTDDRGTADDLLRDRGHDIAQLAAGERETLSGQECDEILAHRMSYLSNDLIVPTWSGTFLYDRGASADATLDILEFANSQLLEFRYYDERLDADLTRIYGDLQAPRRSAPWIARRYERTARQLHSLFIEVSELTERTENAIKFIGDAHAARLFALVAVRLGLSAWKASVRGKLEMLDSIYRFTVEQSAMARGQFLELTIVLILVLELVLIFMGVLA